MYSISRMTITATLLVLIAGVTPKASAAAGAPGPPVIIAPSGGTPAWSITVPVKLASIPSRYPRFAVVCQVRLGNGNTGGYGRQDWQLTDGGYSGAVNVRVFVTNSYLAQFVTTYDCWLQLLDANNQPHDVGPNQDPWLRPEQGTTFVGSITGLIP
jgi:hypothetical protein